MVGTPERSTHNSSVSTRRRMYLFERAYTVYAGLFRTFVRRLGSTCRFLWDWGECAENLLAVAGAVCTGVFFWFVWSFFGRAFGLVGGLVWTGSLAVLVVIFWISLELNWDVVARAVSGVAAVLLILAMTVAVSVPAAVIFIGYLLLLFALTALSFLVFLPMRGLHELWMLHRRLSYHCPNDDCHYKGLPIHICECGHAYSDLQPSFYGTFHHTCRHADKNDVKLPTMDFLGRSKLTRLCGGCQRELIHSSIGELEIRSYAVVAGPSSGKSVFLVQAVRALRQYLTRLPGSAVQIDSTRQEEELSQSLEMLDRGQMLRKTTGDVVQALGLAIKVPKSPALPGGLRCLLHLYDAPGEHFEQMEQFGRKQAIRRLTGIILLVDPFALPLLGSHANTLGAGVNASRTPFGKTVSVLIAGVHQMLQERATDRSDVPVAVVLAKADAFPVRDYPFLSALLPDESAVSEEALNTRCRTALEKLGEGNSIRLLEQKFKTIRSFACSALGRTPDSGQRASAAFEAQGVLELMLWLMNIEGGTASDARAAVAVRDRVTPQISDSRR